MMHGQTKIKFTGWQSEINGLRLLTCQ